MSCVRWQEDLAWLHLPEHGTTALGLAFILADPQPPTNTRATSVDGPVHHLLTIFIVRWQLAQDVGASLETGS